MANYINGSNAQSNIEQVTLLEEQGHGYELGDVNHDGLVSVGDVAAIINYLLMDGGSDICIICADLNGDGKVTVGDVSGLIAKLLGSK